MRLDEALQALQTELETVRSAYVSAIGQHWDAQAWGPPPDVNLDAAGRFTLSNPLYFEDPLALVAFARSVLEALGYTVTSPA